MGSLLRLIGRHRHQDGQGSKRGRVLRGAGADVQGLLQADGHQQGWPAGQERPPGTSLAHPTPQVTSPTTVHLPDSPWQTRGLPPSPVQASFPTCCHFLVPHCLPEFTTCSLQPYRTLSNWLAVDPGAMHERPKEAWLTEGS